MEMKSGGNKDRMEMKSDRNSVMEAFAGKADTGREPGYLIETDKVPAYFLRRRNT